MVARKKIPTCPVEAYAVAVVRGNEVAGRLVRLACERHLRDLKDGKKRGLKFDHGAAEHVFNFFGFLRLPEGDKPFELRPWQKFIVGSLFGWKGPDGFRRFRTSYTEAGKGSGKSPLAAGIGLYGLQADGERSAEIYSAAVTREQAGIMFRDAHRMASNSPAIAKRLEIGLYNLAYPAGDSFFRCVSSEHRGLDGRRVHFGLIDEIHEHPNDFVVNKIRAGTKNRDQALIFEITNSGHDRTTVCWQHREYSEKILGGILEDDSWFAYVCTLDPCAKCIAEGKSQPTNQCPNCDDWRDETKWAKACPNLDVSVTRKYLREQVREAEGMPAKENIVKRLNFCIWTEHVNSVIPMDAWDSCAKPIDLASLVGRPCFGGLDIGSTSDFTAFVLVFPHDDIETVEVPVDPTNPDGEKTVQHRRSYTLLPYFWLPEISVKRDKALQSVIDVWRRAGHIRTTSGNVVDYDQVNAEILEICQPYSVGGIGIDRGFQGAQFATNLQKHFGDLVEQVPQGILSMNAPFRELLELVKQHRLHHDGNPVLRWMASNTAAEERGGLIKPSKDKSSEKIDGIVASIEALALMMRDGTKEEPTYYDTHEVEFG